MQWALLFVAVLAGSSQRALSQDTSRALPAAVFVGSEAENYLRTLQTLGVVPLYPWSARAFSREDLERLTPRNDSNPWFAWPGLYRRERRFGWLHAEVAPLVTSLSYNTGFPFGFNDGAVWAGRGATAVIQGGGSLRAGPLSVVVAPTAFWSENRSFGLAATRVSTQGPFADALVTDDVDRPQRFGDKPYARLDPGQTTVRLSGKGVQVGASTANLWWGPMSEFPYLMGNNAPGFTHVFLGTSSPRNVFIGRFHAQVLYARLTQTAYSPVQTGQKLRFGSGVVAVFEPRLLPGLEVGATRFFHAAWPDSGGPTKEYYLHLFETFMKANISKVFAPRPDNNQSADNQLASVFARWGFPKSGLEVYTEFGREDHNWDARDIIVEPDHSAGVGFGIRKAFRNARGVRAARFESMNYQVSTIARHRAQGGAYYHGYTPQGHTERGQLLATGIAAGGGAAAMVGYDVMEERGATRWSWYRLVTLDRGSGAAPSNAQHVLRFERERLHGRRSLRTGASVIADFNRNLTTRDAVSLRFDFGWVRY